MLYNFKYNTQVSLRMGTPWLVLKTGGFANGDYRYQSQKDK